MRPDASWCTLCYQDFRPASQLVTTPTTDGGDLVTAPLVEASLEPGSGHWTAGDGDPDDIVDAELVGDPADSGRIYAPRNGSHDASSESTAFSAAPAAVDPELDENGEPSRLAALTWSCKCGEVVSFAEDACPVCGGTFLSDLHDGAGGRHRPGHAALSWIPESRQVRLALSAFLAVAIAVFIPLILSLFG